MLQMPEGSPREADPKQFRESSGEVEVEPCLVFDRKTERQTDRLTGWLEGLVCGNFEREN